MTKNGIEIKHRIIILISYTFQTWEYNLKPIIKGIIIPNQSE